MDSQLRTYTSYSADAAQRDDDEKGSHKGPPLKIGRNHKLAHHYIEQKILGEPIEGEETDGQPIRYSPNAIVME